VKVIDAIARILKIEGAELLSAYPTTPLIEAAAKAEIRPVLCRQERVGVGIADGYARVTNGKKLAVFCMQYGPGAENAFPGVATAYSDSTPMLLLPLGHQRDRAQVFPLFSSARTFASVTKSVETVTLGSHVADVMRRAISLMRMGRPGPVSMAIEIPRLVVSHDKYGTRDIGGRYADLGRAMGGWSERVERPEDIPGAFARARKATEGGRAALLEFITSQETRFSNRGVLR
jgi:acetolactate synthase I/II/III large subunit